MLNVHQVARKTSTRQAGRVGSAESPHPYLLKPYGGRRRRQMPHAQSRVKEIDFVQLEDGSLVELVEDPGDPTRTALAVWKEGQVSYTDRVELPGQILVPLRREGAILKHVMLPRGIRPYKSVQDLLGEVEALISRCVVIPDGYVAVLASFVLSTWLVDRLPVSPYVSLVGLPQSGKTTLLKTLSLVCRRPLLTADITSAAFYDACARLTPTLLIDETGTHGNNRYLRHLLRMGTTRDVLTMRKNQTFHAYGAKVICFHEPPDDPALNSRCILVPMTEANRPNLIKPTDPALAELGAELQQRLLQLRFDTYREVRPAAVPGAERLRPRPRDLLSCLAALSADDPERCQFLLRFFEFQGTVTQEPLSPPQNAVLRALFLLIHLRSELNCMSVSNLTGVVNNVLQMAGERLPLQPRKVGSVLTSLGFMRRQRTNQGWKLWLDRSDQQKIHQLAKTYGIDHLATEWIHQLASRLALVPAENCSICEKMGIAQEPQYQAKRQEQ